MSNNWCRAEDYTGDYKLVIIWVIKVEQMCSYLKNHRYEIMDMQKVLVENRILNLINNSSILINRPNK